MSWMDRSTLPQVSSPARPETARTPPAPPSQAKRSTLGAANLTATPAAAVPADTSASADAGVITSSDFLTLLVTELKNQDPTANQDPNAYITQLVGVNSLQQLISIDQELNPAASTSTSGSATGAAAHSPASSRFNAPSSSLSGLKPVPAPGGAPAGAPA